MLLWVGLDVHKQSCHATVLDKRGEVGPPVDVGTRDLSRGHQQGPGRGQSSL
jgi:hypothetical protein